MGGRKDGVGMPVAGMLVRAGVDVLLGCVGTPKNCKKSACRIGCGALNADAEFHDTKDKVMPNDSAYLSLIVSA